MSRRKQEFQKVTFMTDEEKAAWVDKLEGSSGPQLGREESITYSISEDGFEEVLVYTTRGATVAELLSSGRAIKGVSSYNDEVFRIRLPGDEYKVGGVLRALKQSRNFTDEQREAAGQRLSAARAKKQVSSDPSES